MPQLCDFKKIDEDLKLESESNKYVNEIKRFKHRFKHKLGQNFIKNERILDKIVKNSFVSEKDVVLEIGAGMGFLTEKLVGKVGKLVVVEYDKRLYEYLRDKFKKELDSGKMILINDDFLRVKDDVLSYSINKCVSNLPYQISSKVVEWLAFNKIESVLMLQKEFVERILDSAGSKNYSRLSVLCDLYFERIKVMDVDKKNFYPKPKVDSSVVRLIPKYVGYFKDKEAEEKFLYFVKALFIHKNKKAGNSFYNSRSFYGLSKEKAKEISLKMPYNDKKVRELGVKELVEMFEKIKGLI